MYTFSRSHREKKMFVCSFITMNGPFKSTLGIWEVMCSILPHDIIKHHDFCWKIRISDLRSGCNKFYSSLGSNSLDGRWPFSEDPLVHQGKLGKSLNSFSWKYCDTFENVHFFAFTPREKNVRLVFYYNECPFQKHPWQLGGHVFISSSWHDEPPRFSLKNSNFRLEIGM